jgi:hypothetical protein
MQHLKKPSSLALKGKQQIHHDALLLENYRQLLCCSNVRIDLR